MNGQINRNSSRGNICAGSEKLVTHCASHDWTLSYQPSSRLLNRKSFSRMLYALVVGAKIELVGHITRNRHGRRDAGRWFRRPTLAGTRTGVRMICSMSKSTACGCMLLSKYSIPPVSHVGRKLMFQVIEAYQSFHDAAASCSATMNDYALWYTPINFTAVLLMA